MTILFCSAFRLELFFFFVELRIDTKKKPVFTPTSKSPSPRKNLYIMRVIYD